MRSLPSREIDGLWDRYWSEMRPEWFKLEVLQDYTGEDDGPSLRAWLKGDKQTALKLLETDQEPEFTADCRRKRAEGVDLRRIHVVDRPLTPYMEWEIENYKLISVRRRGERVCLIDRAGVRELDLPGGDLMLFDDSRAIVNSYDRTGRLVKADFYDERDDLSRFLELRQAIGSNPELRPVA